MRLREGRRGKQQTNQDRGGGDQCARSTSYRHLISLPLALGRRMPASAVIVRAIVAI
jgi:hypothetical protein